MIQVSQDSEQVPNTGENIWMDEWMKEWINEWDDGKPAKPEFQSTEHK